MKKEKLLEVIKKKFPDMWVKDGEQFNGGSALLWSGEGSMIGNLPAFDYNGEIDYLYNSTAEEFGFQPKPSSYECGVLKTLVEWSFKKGIFWECYDPGTYLAYIL